MRSNQLSQWLGMLGPILRAEVGDTLRVVFKNMASHNYSIHPHGLRYTKPNEGLYGPEQVFGGNSVPPGDTWTYTWEVPGKCTNDSLDRKSCRNLRHLQSARGRGLWIPRL